MKFSKFLVYFYGKGLSVMLEPNVPHVSLRHPCWVVAKRCVAWKVSGWWETSQNIVSRERALDVHTTHPLLKKISAMFSEDAEFRTRGEQRMMNAKT